MTETRVLQTQIKTRRSIYDIIEQYHIDFSLVREPENSKFNLSQPTVWTKISHQNFNFKILAADLQLEACLMPDDTRTFLPTIIQFLLVEISGHHT